jgi:hypothetical protein
MRGIKERLSVVVESLDREVFSKERVEQQIELIRKDTTAKFA